MSNIISLNNQNIKDVLRAGLEVLAKGGVLAYPTETFYALGVKFDDRKALEKLSRLKRRPEGKAFTLIAGSPESSLLAATSINNASMRLIERYWPGPLTLLLPASEGLPEEIVHEGKIAIRVPGESLALSLARETGYPITATSANPSDMPPAETAQKVYEYFGMEIDLIIDGGRTKGGLPSTIADATGDEMKVLRQGTVKIEKAIDNCIAIDLKEAFNSLSPFIQKHTSSVCPSCEKVCCIDRHGTYETEDIIFLRALGEEPASVGPKTPDTEPCRYLRADGCELPRWQRPFRCTWYFCPPLLEEISSDRGRDYRRFVETLQELLFIRRRLIGEATP